MQARPALTRYPTAGARIECSTGKTSKLIPQILISVRCFIRKHKTTWGKANRSPARERYLYCERRRPLAAHQTYLVGPAGSRGESRSIQGCKAFSRRIA